MEDTNHHCTATDSVSIDADCSASELLCCKRAIQKAFGLKLAGIPRSLEGLRDIAKQFDVMARRYDSGSHEMAAIVMRWAADEIEEQRRRLYRIFQEVS